MGRFFEKFLGNNRKNFFGLRKYFSWKHLPRHVKSHLENLPLLGNFSWKHIPRFNLETYLSVFPLNDGWLKSYTFSNDIRPLPKSLWTTGQLPVSSEGR